MTQIDQQHSRFRALVRTATFAFVRGGALAAGGCAVSAVAWLAQRFVG